MDGLVEFLIIGVFVALTMIEGAGRRKKRLGKGPTGKTRPRPRTATRAPRPPPMPEEASTTRTAPAKRGATGAEDETSEGLIPSDVWEEILGLARGEPEKAKTPSKPADELGSAESDRVGRPEPRPREERPQPEPRAVRPEPRPREPRPEPKPREPRPAVAATHPPRQALRETAPAFGSTGQEDGIGQEKGKRGLREEIFGGVSSQHLRRAIVLKEVLGPPVTLRDR